MILLGSLTLSQCQSQINSAKIIKQIFLDTAQKKLHLSYFNYWLKYLRSN